MIDRDVDDQICNLRNRGVKAGMRVAFLADASLNSITTLLALWQLGAVACPLNPRLPKHQLESAVKRLSPVFYLDREEKSTCPVLHEPGSFSLLLFTSGTTKEPKIAAFSLQSLLKNAHGAMQYLAMSSSDSWRLTLPLFHVGGIGVMMRCLLAQAKVCLDESCSYLSLVPTQLYRMLRDQSAELKKAKAIVVGGAPLSQDLLQRSLERGLPIYTTWGMTETSSMVTLGRADADGHSGDLLPNRELKIDEHGEILVRGETLFLGYLEGDRLRRPLDEQGWFATGDLGFLDTKGRLHWKGRKDHLFISLGENIQPEEIEAVLLEAPGIRQAIVVPIPDEEYGTFPIAFVDSIEPINVPLLQSFTKESLPSFKVPRHFFSLKESYGLKPSRYLLTQEASKLLKQS